jgi:hypothetical protein
MPMTWKALGAVRKSTVVPRATVTVREKKSVYSKSRPPGGFWF